MKNGKQKPLPPIRQTFCDTCPFRPGSKTAFLAGYLSERAIEHESRICHSTGGNKVIHRDTKVPEMLCRGARDLQLQFFHHHGVIEAPTDEAWAKAWAERQAKNKS